MPNQTRTVIQNGSMGGYIAAAPATGDGSTPSASRLRALAKWMRMLLSSWSKDAECSWPAAVSVAVPSPRAVSTSCAPACSSSSCCVTGAGESTRRAQVTVKTTPRSQVRTTRRTWPCSSATLMFRNLSVTVATDTRRSKGRREACECGTEHQVPVAACVRLSAREPGTHLRQVAATP
jgi:hypothetical protein